MVTYSAVGAHTITAKYLGDPNYSASPTSSSITQTVNAAATTTAVASSANPSVVGQAVTYTATVAVTAPGAGTPSASDTVTFKDGASTITCGTGSVAFNGTTATCVVTYASTAGSPHSITAVFGGDANYGGSTSSALSQTVNKAATTTSLTSTSNPSVVGQQVFYTATVAVTAPGAGTPSNSRHGDLQGRGEHHHLRLGLHGLQRHARHLLGHLQHDDRQPALDHSRLRWGRQLRHLDLVGPLPDGQQGRDHHLGDLDHQPLDGGPAGDLRGHGGGDGARLGHAVERRHRDLQGRGEHAHLRLGLGGLQRHDRHLRGHPDHGGSHSITAVFGGDANYSTSTSSALTQTVNAAATTTSVASTTTPRWWARR